MAIDLGTLTERHGYEFWKAVGRHQSPADDEWVRVPPTITEIADALADLTARHLVSDDIERARATFRDLIAACRDLQEQEH